MKIVEQNHTFTFMNLCPYCEGDLSYTPDSWVQNEDGTWSADNFDVSCSTEPEICSKDWQDWFNNHSDMPYVNQMPIDEKVYAFIKKNYRFKMDNQ
jgi:hypothetical protein